MDITQPVLNDLGARVGQLTVQLAIATAERDAARAELAALKAAQQQPEPEVTS